MLVIVGASSALPTVLEKETTYRVAVVAPAPRGLDAALQRAAEPFDGERAAAGRRDRRRPDATSSTRRRSTRCCSSATTGSSSGRTSTRSLRQPPTRPCGALRRHLPPAPELTTATLEPAGSETSDDAEALVAMLGAALLLGSLADLRPVGTRRRGRGEEQPRRRADPVDRAAAPPARRQGDRDRAARADAARARRRARRRPARRRRLRRSGIARPQRRARRALVRARVRALRGRLRQQPARSPRNSRTRTRLGSR